MLTATWDDLNMGDDEAVTIGELGRRIDRLEQAVQGSFKAIDDRLSTHVVSRDYYDGRHAAVTDRLARLEAVQAVRNARWWAVGVAVAAALLTSVGSLVAVLIQGHP